MSRLRNRSNRKAINTLLIYDDLQLYLNNMTGVGVIKEQMALRRLPSMSAYACKKINKDVAAKQNLVKMIYEHDHPKKKK